MELPVALNHINLWAIAGDHGWTIVDSGISHPGAADAWEKVLREDLGGRPVTQVIVTHMHADHAGFAGWLAERFNCSLWMTRREYLGAQAAAATTGDEHAFRQLHARAGWQPDEIAALGARRRTIAGFYGTLPDVFRRICDGDAIEIGGALWTVITGGGHSPEHASLYCAERGLFISGDLVLPGISSNVSVDPLDPEGDPFAEWFAALGKIRSLVPDSVMVLPSHGHCFYGLHDRIDALIEEQQAIMQQLDEALVRPHRADELFPFLFSRPIPRSNIPLMGLATGETLAVLNHLIAAGTVERFIGHDGVLLYQRSEEIRK